MDSFKSFVFILQLQFLVNVAFSNAAPTKLETIGTGCSVQQPPPSTGINCAPNSTATLEDAKALAWTYAPVAKFHPLERYHLQDMATWYNASTIFLTDFKPYPNSTFNFIEANQTNKALLGPKTFASLLNSTKITKQERQALLDGAPFDADGRSTAPLYYTVENYSDSLWLYNFNFFYSWNGCSNQIVSLSFNGSLDTERYIMCPAGIHEGDLERVSMLVCKSDLKIKRIAYSQHGWTEVRNCEVEGDCPFDEATGNPITYVALEGHGNYPTNDGFHVYFYQGSELGNAVVLDNLGGVYVGDRTGDDPDKTFIPTPENVVYIPPAWEIEEQLALTDDGQWQWAVFPGNWGAPLSASPLDLYCFGDNETTIIACPSNSTTIKAIETIAKATNLGNTINEQEDVTVKKITNSSRVGYPELTGPLLRSFSYNWEAAKVAPILTANLTSLTCPDSIKAVEEFPTITELNASTSTIVNYLIGVTVGTLIFSIVIIIILGLPVVMDKSAKIQDFAVRQASWVVSTGKKGIGIGKNNNADMTKEAVETETSVTGISETIREESQVQAQDDPSQTGRSLSFGSTVSAQSEYVNLDFVMDARQHFKMMIWGLLATAIFIAGIVTLAIGINQMFSNSVLTVAADKLGANSIVSTLNWLTTGIMIFIIVCDVFMFFLIFAFNDRTIHFWKFKIPNYVGGRKAFINRAFEILVFCIGLISLIIALCAVLFSLGLIISLVQLSARVACNAIFSISVLGTSIQAACIEVPSIDLKVCGWEAFQTCSNATSMHVRLIMVGAMLLLWCHTLWLIILMSSAEAFRTHKIKVYRSKKSQENVPCGLVFENPSGL